MQLHMNKIKSGSWLPHKNQHEQVESREKGSSKLKSILKKVFRISKKEKPSIESFISNPNRIENAPVLDNLTFGDWEAGSLIDSVIRSEAHQEQASEAIAQIPVPAQTPALSQAIEPREITNPSIQIISQHTSEISEPILSIADGLFPPTKSSPEEAFKQPSLEQPSLEQPSLSLFPEENAGSSQDIQPSASEASSPSGNDESTWKFIIQTMEKQHEDDIVDLKEDHQVEVDMRDQNIKRLEEEIEQNNQRDKLTQIRVNNLLQAYNDLQSEAVTVKETLKQANAEAQAGEASYDELKRECENLTPISAHGSPFQGTSAQLETVAEASFQELESSTTNKEHIWQGFQAMAADLRKVLDENSQFCNENYSLKQALREDPERDPGIGKVLDYKNEKIRELNNTANEYAMKLSKLQRKSSADVSLANHKIDALHTQLSEERASLSLVHSSMSEYKEISESILAMLKGKVHTNQLIQAMEEYFQVALEDNQILVMGSKQQSDKIDEMYQTVDMLQAELMDTKASLEEKEDICHEYEDDRRAKDTKLEVLAMKSESLEYEHEKIVQQKDRELARFNREVVSLNNALQEMVVRSFPERQQFFVEVKEKESRDATARCQELSQENYELQECLHARVEQEDNQMCLNYITDQQNEQDVARYVEAEATLEVLREEIKLLQRLPSHISITQVLEEREELVAARDRIRALECHSPEGKKLPAEASTNQTILQLKLIGYRILGVMADFNIEANSRGYSDNFDEVRQYITKYTEILDGIAADENESNSNASYAQEENTAANDEDLLDSKDLSPRAWARRYPPR